MCWGALATYVLQSGIPTSVVELVVDGVLFTPPIEEVHRVDEEPFFCRMERECYNTGVTFAMIMS